MSAAGCSGGTCSCDSRGIDCLDERTEAGGGLCASPMGSSSCCSRAGDWGKGGSGASRTGDCGSGRGGASSSGDGCGGSGKGFASDVIGTGRDGWGGTGRGFEKGST